MDQKHNIGLVVSVLDINPLPLLSVNLFKD